MAASSSSSSNSSPNAAERVIFLSHSGKQKEFVRRLYDALKTKDRNPFMDTHSLPPAEKFSENIETAARNCALGVVVLSEDFLKSKWPMMELHLLMDKSCRQASRPILPLFYKLQPPDLKRRMEEWKKSWNNLLGKYGSSQVDLSGWEADVRELDAFNGVVYSSAHDDTNYLDEVVDKICRKIPRTLLYSLSFVKGIASLENRIMERFNIAKTRCGSSAVGPTRIGLYGTRGSGKTTACKVMVNHFESRFPTKSVLLKFPNKSNKESDLVKECKDCLHYGLRCIGVQYHACIQDFDQVIEVMKNKLSNMDLFLALDNVLEHSKWEAHRILEVRFGAQSKILITSTSQQVVRDLLGGSNHHDGGCMCICPVPAMVDDDAVHLFDDGFGGELKGRLVDDSLIKRAMQLGMFDGQYHPLALRALGDILKKIKRQKPQEDVESLLSQMVTDVSKLTVIKHSSISIYELMKLDYDEQSDNGKSIFLDIGGVITQEPVGAKSLDEVLEWLSILYEPQLSKGDIVREMEELASAGLIQYATGMSGEHRVDVEVHDLWLELVKDVIACSSRFLVCHDLKSKPELDVLLRSVKWEKLERVIICQPSTTTQMLVVNLQPCPNLSVLLVDGPVGIEWMDTLPSLRVLEIRHAHAVCSRKNTWICLNEPQTALPSQLAKVTLERTTGIDDILQRLIYPQTNEKALGALSMSFCDGPRKLRLDTLLGLESVHICKCGMEKIYLRGLPYLKKMHIEICEKLEAIDVRKVGSLETVAIRYCQSLKRITWGSGLTCLRKLKLHYCKELRDLGGLPEVESLDIWQLGIQDCGWLEGSIGSLKYLQLGMCERVRSMNIEALQRMSLGSSVGGLCALETVRIVACHDVVSINLGSGLANCLRTLLLFGCYGLEELRGLDGLCGLVTLEIRHCRLLRKLKLNDSTGKSGLASLQTLAISGSEVLEEVCGLDAVVNLRTLEVVCCRWLQQWNVVSSIQALVSLQNVKTCRCHNVLLTDALPGRRVDMTGCYYPPQSYDRFNAMATHAYLV